MRGGTCWIISLLSAAAGAGVVVLLHSPSEKRTGASLANSSVAIPETPPRKWHLTVTLTGTTAPAQEAIRVIQVYRSGSVPPRMMSMRNYDRLLDPDPIGNLDRYRFQSALADAEADQIYCLSRLAILSHRLSTAERYVRDGTTLSFRLDVGDTGIEISFRHSMRPSDEVLGLIAAIDVALPVEHRIGRGDYAVDARSAGPR